MSAKEARPWNRSLNGVVESVDRVRGEGWIRGNSTGRKRWFFMGHDLTGGLCISKVKKGTGVFFQAIDGPNPRAKKVCPLGAVVIDNSESED